ncbi:MAG: ABC transporter permease [Actinobacteria bacterium]|nr:ABC transporter permease [Actinomycetota bacterium]
MSTDEGSEHERPDPPEGGVPGGPGTNRSDAPTGGGPGGGGGGERLARWFSGRIGGFLVPAAAAFLAFLVGGVVVLATGHNPLGAYKAIFEGTGLNVASYFSEDSRQSAWGDLQQTLIVFTPLVLGAIAVAFAFRCGMFNIGGQGQYLVGLFAALYVGVNFDGLAAPLHILLASVAAVAAGAIWGGIAGFLKAAVGAHEVITTIMLNWIAVFGGQYLFELGGPLQGANPSVPRSETVVESAQLPEFPGSTGLQPLHIGVLVAVSALAVYYVILNRTTLGYGVRAVGFNPEAARYGGIPVGRNYFLALAISGAFAGLGGAMDVLGWKFTVATNDIQVSDVGFIGIAVALLGRNKAVGIFFAALLFAALRTGTSTRQLDAETFPPELAGNLSTMIQALIILFVGAELLIVYIWGARRRFRPAGPVRIQPGLKQ